MNKVNKKEHGVRPARTKTAAADLLGSNSEIARKLGDYYKELLTEDVPDRFAELLDRLERAEHGSDVTAFENKAEG